MALKDANIGPNASSTGTGGILTVYDPLATKATIVGNAYWAIGTNEDFETRRKRESAEDFVRNQQVTSGTVSTGVVGHVVGSNGVHPAPYNVKLTNAGRLTWTVGS